MFFSLMRPLLLLILTASPALAAPVLFSPQQLQADLRFLRNAIATTHPDTSHSAAPDALAKAYGALEQRLAAPITRDQAFIAMASLNAVFADGHLGVVMPDWRAQTLAHLQAGGRLFPFETYVKADGAIYIRAELGGAPTALAGMRIDTINGKNAREAGLAMLALSLGDTPQFRAHVLARRMWLSWWKLHGAPARYDFMLSNGKMRKALRVAGSAATPAAVADTDDANDANFERMFRFDMVSDKTGLLTIRQFSISDKKLFYAFAEQAFQKLRDAKATALIIDVRDNTGGGDEMWKQGVLRYIADKPFRNGSSYVKKVIAGRASGSEKVGDVVHGTVDSWVQPEPDHPLHFSGATYVLVGRLTYSSAVLFSNVVQDFGFGKLVGAGGYARTRQSGGTQFEHILPNTGLEIVVPRFVLDRPSGQGRPALLSPDIVLADDPFDGSALIDTLVARIVRAR